MASEYEPDSWVVIKMTHKDKTFYKVLGGWSGSYIYGSSWRLNSGIERVEIGEDNRYHFIGASGSLYKCFPEMYGLRSSTFGVFDSMKNTYPDQVEILPDCDWTKFDFGVMV